MYMESPFLKMKIWCSVKIKHLQVDETIFVLWNPPIKKHEQKTMVRNLI
jgi:hypothetical protein